MVFKLSNYRWDSVGVCKIIFCFCGSFYLVEPFAQKRMFLGLK